MKIFLLLNLFSLLPAAISFSLSSSTTSPLRRPISPVTHHHPNESVTSSFATHFASTTTTTTTGSEKPGNFSLRSINQKNFANSLIKSLTKNATKAVTPITVIGAAFLLITNQVIERNNILLPQQQLLTIMKSVLITTDLLLTGFTLGVTIWHFFLQSPLMFKRMGKEKFVPIMMALTKLWADAMIVSSTGVLLSSIVLYNKQNVSFNPLFVAIGWLAMTINRWIIVPKALQAGAASTRERKGDNSKDVKEFAVQGGGKSGSNTSALHRTVVVFVFLMVFGFLPHSIDLVSAVL